MDHLTDQMIKKVIAGMKDQTVLAIAHRICECFPFDASSFPSVDELTAFLSFSLYSHHHRLRSREYRLLILDSMASLTIFASPRRSSLTMERSQNTTLLKLFSQTPTLASPNSRLLEGYLLRSGLRLLVRKRLAEWNTSSKGRTRGKIETTRLIKFPLRPSVLLCFLLYSSLRMWK